MQTVNNMSSPSSSFYQISNSSQFSQNSSPSLLRNNQQPHPLSCLLCMHLVKSFRVKSEWKSSAFSFTGGRYSSNKKQQKDSNEQQNDVKNMNSKTKGSFKVMFNKQNPQVNVMSQSLGKNLRPLKANEAEANEQETANEFLSTPSLNSMPRSKSLHSDIQC
jgi:hypothetical protein